jgi:1-acyl-sn-glycerol-3-phosphate acyltransferase
MIRSAFNLFTILWSYFGILLVILVANVFQALFTPLYFISVPLYRYLDGLVYRCGIRVIASISYIASGGIEYIITGDEPLDEEMQKNHLFLVNHISTADW